VLFRSAECTELATRLAEAAIPATVRRVGLLATPEARAAVLGLRLFIDARDHLAAAELARLTRFPEDADAWLDGVLDAKASKRPPFADLGFHERLAAARARFPAAGPLAALDAAVHALDLRSLVAQWGDSALRFANLDALRAHAVDYVAHAEAEGSAATPAGLVAHLDFLEESELDTQATLPGADAVVVSTWHRAKGLEWPITVLALVGQEHESPRFGFSVKRQATGFSLERPLEGRWVRFWPNPFHPSQRTEFNERVMHGPDAAAEQAEAQKQELRLLYVGWTRARDRLVLARGGGEWMLTALDVPEDAAGRFEWAGVPVEALVRECAPGAPHVASPVADPLPIARGPVERPRAFFSPSEAEATAAQVRETVLGERLAVTASDMNELGQALHAFFAVDRPHLEVDQREALARECLAAWGQRDAVEPRLLVKASNALRGWADGVAPGATWHRELPLTHRLADGSELRGIADLVLEADDGFWVVDHKSFPGGAEKGLEKARGFAGQLTAYARALEAAWRKPCRGTFIHLAALGRIVELTP
jgi:ATP-dependent exoDNAse (exonuclease V) beta subunit